MNRIEKSLTPLPPDHSPIICCLREGSLIDLDRINLVSISGHSGIKILKGLVPSFKAPEGRPGDLYEANPDNPIQQCLDHGSLCTLQRNWSTLPAGLKEEFSGKVVLAWKTICRTSSGLSVPGLNCRRPEEALVIRWVTLLTLPFPHDFCHALEI